MFIITGRPFLCRNGIWQHHGVTKFCIKNIPAQNRHAGIRSNAWRRVCNLTLIVTRGLKRIQTGESANLYAGEGVFCYFIRMGNLLCLSLLRPENNRIGAFYVTALSHLPSEEARNGENTTQQDRQSTETARTWFDSKKRRP